MKDNLWNRRIQDLTVKDQLKISGIGILLIPVAIGFVHIVEYMENRRFEKELSELKKD